MTEREQEQLFHLSPAEVKGALAASGLAPLSRLGQNFLIDGNVARKIVAALEPGPDDLVLEIGPGPGFLSVTLAAPAGRFLAVEIDPGMAKMAAQRLSPFPSAQVLKADALKADLTELVATGWQLSAAAASAASATASPAAAAGVRPPPRLKVFSNLPYYITTPLLMKVLEESRRLPAGFPTPDRGIFMVQKEVAARILAKPGGKDYGILTLAVQYYSQASLVCTVSRNSFWPAPDVDSVVIRLDFRAIPAAPLAPEDLFPVVRGAFGQRRKKIANALAASPGLSLSRDDAYRALAAAGVDPDRRGETLSLDEFVRLATEWKRISEQRAIEAGRGGAP